MTRPTLADITQRADMAEARGYDYVDATVLLAAIRDVLAVAAPHTEWLARREAKLGRAETCVCDACKIVRAITAHIDTTPKEN